MNHIALIGRLTRQPELRVTTGGTSVCTFTLAVDRPRLKGRDKETDFIDCVTFGRTAENVAKYLDKGSQVAVEGRLQIRFYEAKDGTKRKVSEVIVAITEFLGSRRTRHDDDDYDSEEE